MMKQARLTAADVERLDLDRSLETRSDAASKVALLFTDESLRPAERRLAEDILRRLAEDVAVEIRETLSRNLMLCPYLPREIAMTLARDVESVAVPLLQVSSVFTDEDLIEIVRSEPLAKQLAVARRESLSDDVADSLVETAVEEVAVTLLANEKADLSEPTLNKVIDIFPRNEAVHRPLVRRLRLPPAIAARLVGVVSEKLRAYLVRNHEIPSVLARDLMGQTSESVMVKLAAGPEDDAEVLRFAEHLRDMDKLTPTLMLLALCNGDVALFEAGLSVLAEVQLADARTLIRDAGTKGLRAIYDKAGLPKDLYAAYKTAVRVAITHPGTGDQASDEARVQRIIDGLVTEYQDIEPAAIETVLFRLRRRIGQAEERAENLIRLVHDQVPGTAKSSASGS